MKYLVFTLLFLLIFISADYGIGFITYTPGIPSAIFKTHIYMNHKNLGYTHIANTQATGTRTLRLSSDELL